MVSYTLRLPSPIHTTPSLTYTYAYTHVKPQRKHSQSFSLISNSSSPSETPSILIKHSTNMASSPASSDNKKLAGVAAGEEKPIPVHENVLQKHAAFFDLNHDGVIYPWETYKGLREIGSGVLLSIGGALFINLGLSQTTRPGKFPSLLFPIEIKNIKLAKHGSDTGVYDTEGRFVASKFEEIFIKHAHTHSNALTYDELKEMIKANREPKDFKGRIGSLAEWKVLYKLGKDKNGLLQKETIQGVYDGSLFEVLKKKHSAEKKK